MNTKLTTGASSRIGSAALLMVIVLLLIAMAQVTHAQKPTSVLQISCQQIAVFGAVRIPSRVDASRPLRLLEVLGKVGGPSEWAGKTVRIIHNCDCSPCDKLQSKTSDVNEYNLVDLPGGRESGNPQVAPGDIVMVPLADSIYVMGNVRKVAHLRFVAGMTATRAVALAGGVVKSSALVVIRIRRTSAGASQPNPIIINLGAVIRDRTEDPVLQPFDVVEISDEWGRFQPPRLSYPIRDSPPRPRKENSGS